jgi:hypothetical protein
MILSDDQIKQTIATFRTRSELLKEELEDRKTCYCGKPMQEEHTGEHTPVSMFDYMTGGKLQVMVEELEALQWRRMQIHQTPLREIAFTYDGTPIVPTEEEYRDFEFTGLANWDFVQFLIHRRKYTNLQASLEQTGIGQMQCFGDSMLPVLKSGSLMTFQKMDTYKVGDAVFCKISDWFIDCHYIVEVNKERGYLIADSQGNKNGWTKEVYGKAIRAELDGVVQEL